MVEREHEPTMRLADRAERVVENHPTGRVQQKTGKRQALLLVERQLPVPAFDPVQLGHQVA